MQNNESSLPGLCQVTAGFVPSIENAFGMVCTSLPYNSIKGNRVLVFLLMNASLVKHSAKMHRCLSCTHGSCTPDSCLLRMVVRCMFVTQYVLLSSCHSSVVEHWLHKPGVLGSIPSDCRLFTFLRFSLIIKAWIFSPDGENILVDP